MPAALGVPLDDHPRGGLQRRGSPLWGMEGPLPDPPLVRQVNTWPEELWSPQEIAERLRLDFGDDPTMQVSHETIYQSLFV